jgi:hypothetical protein
VFNTVIPRNVRLAEAPSYGLPGVVFDPAARGSQAFVAFAQELVEKMPPASAFALARWPADCTGRAPCAGPEKTWHRRGCCRAGDRFDQ